MTDLRRRRKDAGLCTECGEPSRPGRVTCAKCAAAYAERQHKRYVRRQEAKGEPIRKRGGTAEYRYIAWRGRTKLAEGTATEVGKALNMTPAAVATYAARGIRRKKELAFIERERIGIC